MTLNEYGPSSQRLDPWYIRTPNNYIKNSSTTPNFHTTSIIDSSWHHIAFVIDSTSGKIYLDGNLQATANWVGPAGIPSNTWPMYFGYYPSGNTPPNIYYYRGKIDDIRLYDKALNNSEVQSAMSSNVTQYQYLWSNGATTEDLTGVAKGTYDVTVTDCNGCTATKTVNIGVNLGLSDMTLNAISIHPNPAKSQITVKAAAILIGSDYMINDLSGKIVLKGKLNSENTMIELGSLTAGIYLFSVGDKLKQSFKVIKE